jgi:hypothetical protein
VFPSKIHLKRLATVVCALPCSRVPTCFSVFPEYGECPCSLTLGVTPLGGTQWEHTRIPTIASHSLGWLGLNERFGVPGVPWLQVIGVYYEK